MNKATNPGRRILALALTVALLLGMTLAVPGPVAVHAEGVCAHVHKVNDAEGGREGPLGGDEDCGYVAGAPCEHDHDEDCGEDGEDCAHVHDEDCGYIEAAPCTHEHDEACGALNDTGDDPTLGESSEATATQITAFAELDDAVRVQGFDLGDVTLADLVLPDILAATGEDDAPLTVEGVAWACTSPDTGFDGEADGLYRFTAVLPDGYTLTDGVALPQITVIVRPDGPAIMPMSLNDDLTPGTWNGAGGHRWVEFGGIIWRVLEVKDNDPDNGGNKTALLLAEESVGYREFHTSANAGDGNWINSDIRAWLNSAYPYDGGTDGFLDENFDAQEQAAIVTTNYTLGGSYDYTGTHGYGKDTTDSSQVFLLSVDDVADNGPYFADNNDRNIGDIWWLRSPGGSGPSAACVSLDGSVVGSGRLVHFGGAIRPALKINLTSGIFTSNNPLYDVEVSVESGGSPVEGAFISFSGASAPDAKNSDSAGQASFRLKNQTPYTLTVSKPGYAVYTESVQISGMGQTIPVELSPDGSVLPETVRFGQHSGSPLQWKVLAIESNGKALLLADSKLYLDTNSSVTTWINSSGTGGFLSSDYFTQAELAVMETYSETGTIMFLLSEAEILKYLPTNSMREFPVGTDSWWTRTSDRVVNHITGALENRYGNVSAEARPAVWVDLTRLVQRDDSGVVTLTPAYAATVEVKDGGGQPINGANVTLTHTSGETYRLWDGAAITPASAITSGGSAAFNLPEGTYTATATATSYTQQSGMVTLVVNGPGNTAAVVMDEDDNTAPSVVSVTPSGNGAAVDGNIVVTFDEAMNTGVGSVTLTPNGGSPQTLTGGSWNNPTNTVYTIGYSGLAYVTEYTIDISGFEDVANNPMNTPGTPFTFTTVAQGQAATPVATPAGGAYTTAQTVTLTSDTTGAAIYYTLDGSDPTVTTNSARTLYATPITVPLGTTLKAYATAQDWTDSAVMEEVYSQAATYTLTVVNGTDLTASGPYAAGARVQIGADNAPAGQEFSGWTGGNGGTFDSEGSATTYFTMPSTNATVTANYRNKDSGGNPDPNPTLKLGGIDTDTVTIGTNYNITIATTYTGSKTLTYSIIGDLPTGMSFNTATGGISGTPANSTEGDYPFTITVKEQNGTLQASRSFTLTVQSAPVTPDPAILRIATPPDDTIRAGYRYSKTFSVTYTGSEPLVYEAQGLPHGLSINPTTGEITGVPAAAGGPYTITVTVKEASGGTPLSASTTYKLTVTDTSGGGNGNGGGSGGNNGGSGGGGNGGSTEKPAPKTQLQENAFAWDGERTLTINHDSVTALGLLSVQWDGQTLTRGTDYTVHQGSVIIRFSEDFMAAQAPGDHTVRAEFMNHYGETTVNLTADTGATDTGTDTDTDTHNPNTGGDMQNPQTGDYDTSPWWWLLALIPAAALTLFAAAQLWRRLRRTEG